MDERVAQRAQETYRVNQIRMASKEQLLIITYDIGIRACSAAERAIAANDIERINSSLQQAQSVVRELMITLDLERGGEIASALMRLYDYMYFQLVDANVHKDPTAIATVRSMLEELKSTWVAAIDKLKTEGADGGVAASAPGAGGTNFAY